jgi:hypothetical protein
MSEIILIGLGYSATNALENHDARLTKAFVIIRCGLMSTTRWSPHSALVLAVQIYKVAKRFNHFSIPCPSLAAEQVGV